MRFNEISNDLNTYIVTVRVICGNSSTTVKTTIDAATHSQARALLCHLYGASNVISVTETLREQGTKVLSADELRVKAMSDQAKRLQQQAKQIKAQNAVKKAQSNLTKAVSQQH